MSYYSNAGDPNMGSDFNGGASSSYYGSSTGYNSQSNYPPQQPSTSSTPSYPPTAGYDMHSWQAQQQQQPSSSAQPVPQTGAYPYYNNPSAATPAATMSFWNPATVAAVAGSVATTGGLSDEVMAGLGRSFLAQSTARMIPGFESTMITLRAYFAVDNQYVLIKMKKILFPFLSTQWRRQLKTEAGPDGMPRYDLPLVDENAPDLYLPSMSLITYVLLCALCYGTANKFNPEVIPDVTTKCLVTQCLEVLAIRLGLYLMQTPASFLDLFSYTGYKYLGLCLNLCVGLLLGHFGMGTTGFYLFFLYTASAASFFMLKTMANNIPLQTSAVGPKREVMVVVFAASQFATMWWVSQTKFL